MIPDQGIIVINRYTCIINWDVEKGTCDQVCYETVTYEELIDDIRHMLYVTKWYVAKWRMTNIYIYWNEIYENGTCHTHIDKFQSEI